MNENNHQVFIKNAETLVAEKKLVEWLKVNRWGLEKEIPEKVFNVFLNAVPEYKQAIYRKEGIPYHFYGVEFRLFPKQKKIEA